MPKDTDLLHIFTGLSTEKILATVTKALTKREALQTQLVEAVTHHPPESLVSFVLSSASAFYLTEHAVNPHIKSFADALYYISTCLTVGYADVYPVTSQGRLISSVVMTFGPALTNNTLDPPGRAVPASAQQQEQIIERLDKILAQLESAKL